jgi:hypothetical protein
MAKPLQLSKEAKQRLQSIKYREAVGHGAQLTKAFVKVI